MPTNPWPEIILTSAACLILVLYHSHLFYQVRKAPLTTSFGLTNRLRRDWVQTIMEGNKDILAVQTLRNWVMASSFLASAAILIGLGILNAAFRTEKLAECSQALNLFGAIGMRGYYFSVPFILWLFGPSWMLMGAVILIVILYKLDRTA